MKYKLIWCCALRPEALFLFLGALDQPESDDSPATRDNDSPPNYCLVQTQKGNLDSLSWHEVRISKITSPENLIVEVDSVGINFKDTLLVMGILDRSAFASGWTKDTIGIECAGMSTDKQAVP